MRDCLEQSVDTFRETTGEQPELLRYGDGYLDEGLVARADELGIRYDLTVEPGKPPRPIPETADGEIATAWLPDWRRVPREPYRPADGDYRRASAPDDRARAIRLVPLSSGPRWLGSSVRRRVAVRRSQGPGWKQRDLLYMALGDWTGPDPFGAMIRRTLDAQRRPYLALAIRTDWADRPDHRRNVERGLDALLDEHGRRPLVFCTPAEACALLDGGAPADLSPAAAATGASLRGSARTR